jgi:hypothetical protein
LAQTAQLGAYSHPQPKARERHSNPLYLRQVLDSVPRFSDVRTVADTSLPARSLGQSEDGHYYLHMLLNFAIESLDEYGCSQDLGTFVE